MSTSVQRLSELAARCLAWRGLKDENVLEVLIYAAATRSELLLSCGREHVQDRKRLAAMRASWNRLSASDKQLALEVCCLIRGNGPEYRMGAFPALHQVWKEASARSMGVEELCLQLVEQGLHHHNVLVVLVNSHRLQLWEMFHYASEYMGSHLKMKGIQDRFKYLASTHPQVFMAAGNAFFRLRRPFVVTSLHLAKELEELEMSNLEAVVMIEEPHLC